MKVRDLIAKLQKFDPDLKVVVADACYNGLLGYVGDVELVEDASECIFINDDKVVQIV